MPQHDDPTSAVSVPARLGDSPGRGDRPDSTRRSATAARMYDYFLGGYHNFPADREAAQAVITQLPDVPMIARANRGFVARAVRYSVDAGVRQFLDIGSGLPTAGNVDEIARAAAADARVVYVDIDPVAVSESLDLLAQNPHATAVRGDLRAPQAILDHPAVRSMLTSPDRSGSCLPPFCISYPTTIRLATSWRSSRLASVSAATSRSPTARRRPSRRRRGLRW